MTINDEIKKILTPGINTFENFDNLGAHFKNSSENITFAAEKYIGQGTAVTGAKYSLAATAELVKCVTPFTVNNAAPAVFKIRVKTPVNNIAVNADKANVDVDIEYAGITFPATVDVRLDASANSDGTINLDKSKFKITKVTINENNATFDGTQFFTANQGKPIDLSQDTKTDAMTLAQLKTLFENNKIQASTQLNTSNEIVSMLKLELKENNNNTNQDAPQTQKDGDKTKDDKTTWTDIAIIATSIASIFGVLLLAKMSFSPSNSEYHDNIKFDDYKDDSITI